MNTERNKINILLVDDHPDSLTALEAVLEAPNYNLVKAGSGGEALRALLQMDFALILLDVRMPDLTGFDIARMIRQREKNRHVPIIFVTGYGKDTESITEGYLTGAVDYLLKPVDPDILRAKSSFFIDMYIKNESLKQAGHHYQQLIETVRVIVWRADTGTLRFSYISKEVQHILGYPAEQLTSTEFFWKDHLHSEDRDRVLASFEKAARDRTPTEIEYRMIAADGRVVWFQTMFRVPEEDAEGAELVGIMLEVTERKEAEQAIRRSNEELEQRVQERTADLHRMLDEKAMLLREIHHRVKNNLQIISSLLSLQKKYVNNRDGWNALNESQNRVLSMALIHEKLYRADNLAEINFATYITDLSSYLFKSFGIDSDRVTLKVESDVSLNIDTAVPCGLIVNELVTNALKYAFPNEQKGEINISLTQQNGELLLEVNDNGVGLPKEPNFEKPESLGMRLVNTLTAQLHGTLQTDTSSGTALKILFTEAKPRHA